MYREFLFLIWDYFRTLEKKYVVYEWVLPLFSAAIIYFFLEPDKISGVSEIFMNNSVALLGVLIGFSITVITILTTSNSESLTEIKRYMTDYRIGNKKITLFKLFLINLTYSVVIEVACLIINLLIPVVFIQKQTMLFQIVFCLDILFVMHLLLLTIRNMTDFYFILFKE